MSTLSRFFDLLSPVPVLVRGACSEWPALATWSQQYFSEEMGDKTVKCWRQSHRGELGTSEDLAMRQFVAELREQAEGSETDVYCGNGPLARIDERLCEQVKRPSVKCEGEEDGDAIGGDRGNLWMGRAGHVSHLHYDSHPGLLCGVQGTKTVELWPPGALTLSETKGWPLNVYRDSLDALPASAMTLTLERGDVLLIPFHWWHLVTSLTDSISVNFWCYPIRAVQLRKFADGHLWSAVASRELARMVAESGQGIEMALDANLVALLTRFHRGGALCEGVFEAQKDQLVNVVLLSLRDRRTQS